MVTYECLYYSLFKLNPCGRHPSQPNQEKVKCGCSSSLQFIAQIFRSPTQKLNAGYD